MRGSKYKLETPFHSLRKLHIKCQNHLFALKLSCHINDSNILIYIHVLKRREEITHSIIITQFK